MIHLQLNPNSGIPVYRQMMDQIKYAIAARTLKAGDQLPSIREMAQRLSINPTTVVKAYSELQHEGVIEMKHGKGVFVAASAKPLSEDQIESALRQLLRQLVVEAYQMGASADVVSRLLKEEFRNIKASRTKGNHV